MIVRAVGGEPERYDRVFFACHSDQALRLLADASDAEREVLGAIRYQRNDVVLHTDTAAAAATQARLGRMELSSARP